MQAARQDQSIPQGKGKQLYEKYRMIFFSFVSLFKKISTISLNLTNIYYTKVTRYTMNWIKLDTPNRLMLNKTQYNRLNEGRKHKKHTHTLPPSRHTVHLNLITSEIKPATNFPKANHRMTIEVWAEKGNMESKPVKFQLHCLKG